MTLKTKQKCVIYFATMLVWFNLDGTLKDSGFSQMSSPEFQRKNRNFTTVAKFIWYFSFISNDGLVAFFCTAVLTHDDDDIIAVTVCMLLTLHRELKCESDIMVQQRQRTGRLLALMLDW